MLRSDLYDLLSKVLFKIKALLNHIINRTDDAGAILGKVSTELSRHVAAGYHYRSSRPAVGTNGRGLEPAG